MRPLLFLFFIILTACNAKKAEVSGGAINNEAPFIWEGPGFPKTIHISDDFNDPDEETKILDTLDAWETALNNYDFFTVGAAETLNINTISGTNVLRDDTFGIYKATNWPYPEYPDALAITQIFAIRYNRGSSNEYVSIQEADVIMNYEEFYFDDPDPFVFDYDFKTVLLHELGHFLGLQHKPRSYNRDNTVMYPSIYSYESKPLPLTVDKQDLASKYSITLPLKGSGSSIVAAPKSYKRNTGDKGEATKIILELRADGECVHHVDGVITSRHQTR